MNRKIGACLIIVVFILLGVTSLPRSEPAGQSKVYSLKHIFKEGDREIIIYKLEASALIKTPGLPRHPVMPMYSKLNQEIENKVLEAIEGEITRIERTYRSSKYYTSKSAKTPRADLLDGKKIIIESNGTITPVGLAPADKIIDEVRRLLSIREHQFSVILPRENIPIKAEWNIPSETVASIFNFSNQKKRTVTHGCTEVGINVHFTGGALKCMLKEIKADVAVIELKCALQGEDNGLILESSLKGIAWFSMKKNRFTRIELSGDIVLDGSQPCTQGSAQGKVVGNGKMVMSYEFR